MSTELFDRLRSAVEYLLESIEEPPDRNCSCHLNPPCNDCVTWGAEREAREQIAEIFKEADEGENKP